MHFNKGKAYGRQGKAPTGLISQHSILLLSYFIIIKEAIIVAALKKGLTYKKWQKVKKIITKVLLKPTELIPWLIVYRPPFRYTSWHAKVTGNWHGPTLTIN